MLNEIGPTVTEKSNDSLFTQSTVKDVSIMLGTTIF